MKVLSLFDGISCARVALERVGISVELYYASEVDRYAIQIAQRNYPDTLQVGSAVDLQGHLMTQIDLLIGGSPCQDLSIAKKNRKGLDGKRSGLFWEYIRILKEVKPKYFVLENVASMPKEAKEVITKELGVEPIMINAALVSAQNRKRLFWTNIKGITQPEDKGILLKDILEKDVEEKYFLSKKITKYVLNGGTKSYYKKPEINPEKAFPLNATMAKMHRAGIDTYISTKRIGQIGKGGQEDRIYSPEGKSVGLSALGGGRGAKTGLYCVGLIPESIKPKGNYLPRERVFSDRGKFRAVSTVSNQQPWMKQDTIIRKLTPVECERLMTLPDRYTEGVSNSQRYKMLGNGFVVDVVAHILKHIDKQLEKHTM